MIGTTRNENTTDDRSCGAALIAVGTVALGVSIYMNGRFGWSLMVETGDKVAMAIIHVLVDFGAAGLVIAGSRMLARRQRWIGTGAMVFAGVLVAYSMVSVYGFMSVRMNAMRTQKAVLSVEEKQAAWLRGQMVNNELSRSERRSMGRELKEQLTQVKATVGIITDSQAASIADALHMAPETVQKVLVMIASGVAQSIKFICFGYGFFLWTHRRKDLSLKDRQKDDDEGGGGKKLSPEKSVVKDERRPPERVPLKPSVVPLRADNPSNVFTLKGDVLSPSTETSVHPLALYLQAELARGRKLHSQTQIARLSGWSEPTVSRQLAELARQGKITKEKDGRRNVVRQRIGDGGGRNALATA